MQLLRDVSSAGLERMLDRHEVTGSIPVRPTQLPRNNQLGLPAYPAALSKHRCAADALLVGVSIPSVGPIAHEPASGIVALRQTCNTRRLRLAVPFWQGSLSVI